MRLAEVEEDLRYPAREVGQGTSFSRLHGIST